MSKGGIVDLFIVDLHNQPLTAVLSDATNAVSEIIPLSQADVCRTICASLFEDLLL
jgi:hypothetical protein